MQRLVICLLLLLFTFPAFAGEELNTDEQKTLYAVGLVASRQIAVFNLTPAEFELVKRGLIDGFNRSKPLVDLDTYGPKIKALAIARRDTQGIGLAVRGNEFLVSAAREKGAVRTDSGVIYLSLKEGNGISPVATDKIKVNYRGTLVDGREFDSSYSKGKPAEYELNKAMTCWAEGIQKMKTGGKARLVCPPDTAYGKNSSGIIPPNATLVFEIELLEIMK